MKDELGSWGESALLGRAWLSLGIMKGFVKLCKKYNYALTYNSESVK